MSDVGGPVTPGGGGIDVCASIPWEMDTDASLGGASQEWEESANPDDITTALTASECILDSTDATILTDIMTGCLKGAEAGITTGNPHIIIRRRIRIRHLTPGQKRRLKKSLGIG